MLGRYSMFCWTGAEIVKSRQQNRYKMTLLDNILLMTYLSITFLYFSKVMFENLCLIACKGKEIPLQAWAGHEDSIKLRLLDFKTFGT